MLLAIACLYGTYELMLRIAYELQGPITADSPLYLAVGRGILNGLVPYKDLYENKPPGIFLLSSLSLWFSGSMRLISILQALIIIALPALVVVGSDSILRRDTAQHRQCGFLLAFLFGILMTLYMAERAGEFQVESFGAFFASTYVVLIADPDARFGRLRTALAAFAIFCSVMMKEPFILPIAASALLFCSHRPSLLFQKFLVPTVLAGVIALFLLFVSGYIVPYFSLYLREMFFHHIVTDTSPIDRAWKWITVYSDLQQYQSYFGIFILLLVGKVFIRDLHIDTSRRMFVRVRHVFCIVLALYLLALAVGMGGQFFNHHFVFAVPGYIALFLLCLQEIEDGALKRIHAGGIFMLAVIGILGASSLPTTDYHARITDIRGESSIGVQAAMNIDRTLDACGLQSYLFIGSNGWMMPYAYTKHSPMGPNFYQYHNLLDEYHPQFRESFLQNLHKTQLIVFREYNFGDLRDSVDQYIHNEFTEVPWDCAKDSKGPPEFVFYYRNRDDAVAVAMAN